MFPVVADGAQAPLQRGGARFAVKIEFDAGPSFWFVGQILGQVLGKVVRQIVETRVEAFGLDVVRRRFRRGVPGIINRRSWR